MSTLRAGSSTNNLLTLGYQVILYTNLGQTGGMPLLLSALWLTTAGLIYNPGGAWLHDRVNSRRWMFMVGTAGCLVTTACLSAMIAQYAGVFLFDSFCQGMHELKLQQVPRTKLATDLACFSSSSTLPSRARGVIRYVWSSTGAGSRGMNMALNCSCSITDGSFQTMYLWVSEIFPTEIRSIGMGFSLFGQFAATIILLQTAPIGFATVGWKYFLVVICWCAVFLPGKCSPRMPQRSSILMLS